MSADYQRVESGGMIEEEWEEGEEESEEEIDYQLFPEFWWEGEEEGEGKGKEGGVREGEGEKKEGEVYFYSLYFVCELIFLFISFLATNDTQFVLFLGRTIWF